MLKIEISFEISKCQLELLALNFQVLEITDKNKTEQFEENEYFLNRIMNMFS